MNIEFDEGESGFWEARTLRVVARRAAAYVRNKSDLELLAFLEEAATTHMERAEFVDLKAMLQPDPPVSPWPWLEFAWRRLWGPSRIEAELSEQRGAALDRADRAERSAFEALAETARVGRERDQLRAEVERLKKEVTRLESDLMGVGFREPGD